MGLPGVHSTNISNRIAVSDEILVNGDGSTGLQTTEELALQLASSGAVASRFNALDEEMEDLRTITASGAQWKVSAAVATTANITLSGEQTIDGYTTSSSRVLVWKNAAPATNGLWLSGAGAWVRVTDANEAIELVGMQVFVENGATHGGKQFICTTRAPITVGTTALNFEMTANLAALNPPLAALQVAVPKKARLSNLFTNGNLDPDGPEFVLFDELFTTNASYTARTSGTVVIEINTTLLNDLGCKYAVNIPANASAVGNRGNKMTQDVNLKGGGIYFSVLVFSFTGGWDFGAAGINSPLATIRYLDGSAGINLGLTTYETVGSGLRRYYGYAALTAGKIASRIELGLDSAPPRADRFFFTGFWASATTESGLAIRDTEYPDWQSKRNFPFGLRNRVAALEASTTIQRFVAALRDDFHSISLCLVGDSITWGTGASGTSASTPRTGALTDPRNTVDETVSPTWANLLIGYLVRTFAQGAITSPAPGVAEARKTVIGDVCNDNIRFKVQNKFTKGPRPKSVTNRSSGPLLMRDMDIPTTAVADDALVFEFTGDEFTVVHANKGGASTATYTIEVDGVVVGSTYEHGIGNAWGFTDTVSVAFGRHVVRIWNNSATQTLRLEAIKVNRLLRVRNQGIIGRTTTSWLAAGVLYPGILAVDEFIMMMTGTNDRGTSAGQINAGVRIRDNIGATGAQLKADGKTLILMTPPRATVDWPGDPAYSFDTQEAAMAVRLAAGDLNVSYIDNYAATAVEIGGALLSDGLHLNDAGQRAVFKNIITSLRLIGQTP